LQEGLRPWQVRKLYSRPLPDAPATLNVPTGVFDPALGRTYAEIAFEGRSQHKSQGQGTTEIRGPLTSGLRIVNVAAASAPDRSLFAGLDTTVLGLARLAGLPDGALRAELATVNGAARKALQEFQPLAPSRIVPLLVEGLRAVRAARQALPRLNATERARTDADFLLAVKERDFTTALLRAAGVIVDPLAEEDTAVPGGVFGVNVRLFLTQPELTTLVSTTVKAPAGWTVSQTPAREEREQGFRARERPSATARYEVRVPAAAAPTQPYFLIQPRQGDRYVWPPGSPKTLPFDPPALVGEATLSIAGVEVVATQPVDYRFADAIRGELRRAPAVVPAVTVGVDASLLIVPLGATPQERRIVVRASSASPDPLTGTLRLRVPTGWSVTPLEAPFALKGRGEQTSAAFTVTAPAARTAGSYALEVEARVGTATYARDLQLVSYPHIQPHRLYSPARSRVEVLSLDVAAVRLGYVMGSGDQVPEAIRRMGIDVTMLDEEALATGDLARFDTIVVGIRASETRPDFVANNGRLLQWVEQGGTLIVQYQQREYFDRALTPYPAAQMSNSRVTDESAAIRILAPGHPVFTFPNQITAADFDGWVQERNLYAFTSFDAQRYTPLLETADVEEPPQRGGQVYAEVGKGRYVYTAYSWFRQLPAGVPGAYRQFANLISLSKAPR
jgi:hypothetical protein